MSTIVATVSAGVLVAGAAREAVNVMERTGRSVQRRPPGSKAGLPEELLREFMQAGPPHRPFVAAGKLPRREAHTAALKHLEYLFRLGQGDVGITVGVVEELQLGCSVAEMGAVMILERPEIAREPAGTEDTDRLEALGMGQADVWMPPIDRPAKAVWPGALET